MDVLDGNAIAGMLFAAFGEEMTTATGTCASCATRSQLAEFEVYLGGPGAVARCRHCGNIVMVLVEISGIACVDLLGLVALEKSEMSQRQQPCSPPPSSAAPGSNDRLLDYRAEQDRTHNEQEGRS